MKNAVINRQYLMGAVMNSHPAICGSIHAVIPHSETLDIGVLTDLFTRELSRVDGVDTTPGVEVLKQNTDNVGIWLNNFCQFVLPFLTTHYKGRSGV